MKNQLLSKSVFALFFSLTICSTVSAAPEVVSPVITDVDTYLFGEDGELVGDKGGEAPEDDEAFWDSMGIENSITTYTTDSGVDYSLYYSNNITEGNVCILLEPSDKSEDEFLELTGWTTISSLDQVITIGIHLDWSNEELAKENYASIYQDLLDREIIKDTHVFLVGYEEGAAFAAVEVCENRERYDGLVTLGDYGLSKEQIAIYSEDCDSWNKCVWIIAPKLSRTIDNNLSFWKTIDNISDEESSEYPTSNGSAASYNTSFTSNLYMPKTSTTGKINPDDKGVSALLYTKEADYYNQSITGNISRYFINAVTDEEIRFFDLVSGNMLIGIKDWRFSYVRTEYEGQQRDYWMYIPESYNTSTEKYSLVICLHGNGGSGEDMIFYSLWNTVADENNCIILFPSSLYKYDYNHYWENTDEEMGFLRNLIESTCENYNIDKSRIYSTGFSNGAGMAQNIAINFSDIIAAAAMGAPAYYDSDYWGTPDNFYPVAVLFSFGTEDKYLSQYGYTADIDDEPAKRHLDYWRMMYRFEQDDYTMTDSDGIKVYEFTNGDGIPVAAWVVVEGKNHSYPDEEVPSIYEFLKNYTKDENGNLYYQGQLVNIG